jgi:acyl-CoA reductase-like NAD-dependent aldehyde dehydrogenase
MPEPSNTWEAESQTHKLPVCVLPVRSLAEALSIVGSRPRTVAASVWTEDGNLALQAAKSLKV